MLVFFKPTFSWNTEHKKWKHTLATGLLFLLHGDECTHVKGHYFLGENANKHDLCSSTSRLVSFQLVVVVVFLWGG